MKFDPSAYVELQMAQLIRKYSTPEGKSKISAYYLYLNIWETNLSHLLQFVSNSSM